MSAGGRERTHVEVRRLEVDDVEAVRTFFARVPEGDRTFFKEDVSRPDVIASWLAESDEHRLIAIVDDEVIGYAAVLRGVAWSRHVAEVRIVIAPEFRQRGIGRLLAQRAVVEAQDLHIEKLVVDVVAGHDRLFDMFTALGFQKEGRLRAQVRSTAGETRDLLVLSHFVADLASSLADDDEMTSPAGSGAGSS
ncbi:hypothetical protein BH24ACT5_BH24ACT5_15080 [soil metagenome]